MPVVTRNQRGEADLAPGPARDLVNLFHLLRSHRTMTVSQIAVKSHLAAGHVSEVLRGWKSPSPTAAEMMARALGADDGIALKARSFAEARSELNRYVRVKEQIGGSDGPFDIPPPPSHFTGRLAETADVLAAITGSKVPHRAPLALIHGMPGIGKTALAAHVAHQVRTRYPDGCVFMDFGCLDDASNVHAWLVRRLGVDAEKIPAEPGEARALYLSILSRRSVLVVADGVTRAGQVASLVPATPRCAVIATSRHRLDALDDCRAIRLGPLSADEAAALFDSIAERPGAPRDRDRAHIVAACGGVPLAVRVAAAKFRHSVRDTAKPAGPPNRPATGWDELDDGERSVHRTLAQEVGELPDEGRRVLTMFALYPGAEASSQAIGWLAGDSARAAAHVAELDRRDLVKVGPDGRASMSVLVRSFASTLAGGQGERSRLAALHRLIAGYTRSAVAASEEITPPRFRPSRVGEQVCADPVRFDGVVSAIAWCRAEAELALRLCALAYDLGLDGECWRLAYAMREYFFTVKAIEPWLASHRIALLAAKRCGDPWAQAVTRNNLGMALMERGRVQPAAAQYRRALDLLAALGDDLGVATTLGHQAWAHHAAGRPEVAISLAARANVVNRLYGNERSVAIVDRLMALAYSKLGRHREALGSLAECQEILSGLALPLDEAMTLNCLGEVHCASGDFSRARVFHALAAERSAVCGGLNEKRRAVAGMARSSGLR
jgi:tetratricopeptide (TPR) repeat protein/transcriptional regulator with XRE-family HTH domain